MTYYDTIGYKTIYRSNYLSYECEHIVQSYSVDRIGKQYVIYRLRAESFINVAQRKHRGKNQIVRKIHRKSKEQLYQQKRNRG